MIRKLLWDLKGNFKRKVKNSSQNSLLILIKIKNFRRKSRKKTNKSRNTKPNLKMLKKNSDN